ncbi:MAG: TolC family protein [Bacteroidaceae bacterium]|nr:TolC family protein [Bacteroidaceae bacterium]
MKRVFMIIIAGCFFFMNAPAQVMTMDECMAYAVEHSVSVCKQENALDNAKMNYRQSVASLFPSVSASISASTNFGRSIDPETNSYTTVSTFGNSYSLSASMPLFAGLRYVNGIRAAKVARERGYSDLQIARDKVAMDVMRAYSDVVYYKGAVKIAEEHLSASRKTLRQAQKLHELGRKSAAEVAEVASQEANYDYLLAEQQNNLTMAWIALREVMNLPQDYTLEVVEEDGIIVSCDNLQIQKIVENALDGNAQVVSSELAVKEYKLHYARAKGAWFPTISLSAGINTNYYTNFDNKQAYPSFSSQFKNNSGEYVGVSMSIPIFSNLSRSASVRSSRNALRNAELELSAVRSSVESEVVQACSRMEGYGKLYNQAMKKVEASQLAYDGIAAKFEKGLVTAIELQSAATTLLQAKSERLRSQLQYMIEKRMVDYYSGIPFVQGER